MAWYTFLNPVMEPLLRLGPFWAVLIVSLIISLIITLVYKFVTNQELMKKLKDEQKEYQQRMKSLKDQPQEMIKVQKEAMKKNMEYMKHSFKPTIITMLPIIIIFGWMNAHLAWEPIYPGETYSITAFFEKGVTGEAELILDDKNIKLSSDAQQPITNQEITWRLQSKTAGPHIFEVKYQDQSYQKKVLITQELQYEEPFTLFQHSDLTKLQINYTKLRPLGPNFSIFGWQPGWLGLYIFFSLVFSMALRKGLKIY